MCRVLLILIVQVAAIIVVVLLAIYCRVRVRVAHTGTLCRELFSAESCYDTS